MGHHDEFALILEKLNQRKKRAAGAEGVEEEKEIMEGNSSSNHHAPPASVEKEPQQSKMRKKLVLTFRSKVKFPQHSQLQTVFKSEKRLHGRAEASHFWTERSSAAE